MIYTVTLNPAIDYVVFTDRLQPGQINRSRKESFFCGGKGINVSMVLKELDVPSVSMGFVAGFTGAAIARGVEEAGIATDFICLKNGFSRINVKMKEENHTETDLNGSGPEIPEEAVEELLAKFSKLRKGDMVVLAGSIPGSLPPDIYERILQKLECTGVKAVVDATGELLRRVLKYKPFMVKPNHLELGEFFGTSLAGAEEICRYGKKLQEMGARNVCISMAEAGAIFLGENGEDFYCKAPAGVVINSVGAGDSLVAGILAGLCSAEGGEEASSEVLREALCLGVAAGSATAFSEGLAEKDRIFGCLKEIRMQ